MDATTPRERALAALAKAKPFQKGQTGNPGGRAKWEKPFREALDRLTAAAAKKDDPEAVRSFAELAAQRLLAVVQDGSDRDAIRAVEVARVHGWGHPKQEIDLHVDEQAAQPIDWSAVPLERRRELLAALDEIDALDGASEPDGGAVTEH